MLKAIGESNQKKQEYTKRTAGQHKEPGKVKSDQAKPNLSDEFFPPTITLPWEEEPEEVWDIAEDFLADEHPVTKKYSLEDISVLESAAGVGEAMTQPSTQFQTAETSRPVTLSPSYALKLSDEQIWQGIIWSEILGEPRCRKNRRY